MKRFSVGFGLNRSFKKNMILHKPVSLLNRQEEQGKTVNTFRIFIQILNYYIYWFFFKFEF